MKHGDFKIEITNPCSQQWGSMEVVDGGRYCEQCQHCVTDLSVMSDAEVTNLINSNTPKCVNVRKDQLDRINRSPRYQNPLSRWITRSASALMLALSSHVVFGQSSARIEASQEITNPDGLTEIDSSKITMDSVRVLKGIVLEEGTNIPLAFVRVNGFGDWTSTDIHGRFSLNVPDEWGDTVTLRTMDLEYSDTAHSIQLSDSSLNESIEIYVRRDTTASLLLGMICVHRTTTVDAIPAHRTTNENRSFRSALRRLRFWK